MVVDGREGGRGEAADPLPPAVRADNCAQAELWPEPLPDGLPAHWISNPAGIPHIVRVPAN
jgi:hypothetical protein